MKPAYEHFEFGGDCSVKVYHRRLPRLPFEGDTTILNMDLR
jgi:hypothetical protein